MTFRFRVLGLYGMCDLRHVGPHMGLSLTVWIVRVIAIVGADI